VIGSTVEVGEDELGWPGGDGDVGVGPPAPPLLELVDVGGGRVDATGRGGFFRSGDAGQDGVALPCVPERFGERRHG
jgi:hypothetical protein